MIGDVMMWGNNLDAERKSGMMGMLLCGIILSNQGCYDVDVGG